LPVEKIELFEPYPRSNQCKILHFIHSHRYAFAASTSEALSGSLGSMGSADGGANPHHQDAAGRIIGISDPPN
jgi:hypothetical protein